MSISDEEEISVLSNALKKRRESIDAYQSAGRMDLVQKEQKELEPTIDDVEMAMWLAGEKDTGKNRSKCMRG